MPGYPLATRPAVTHPTGQQPVRMDYIPPRLTPMPKATVRAQNPDPVRQTLRIPTPQELGIAPNRLEPEPKHMAQASVDWSAVRERLRAMNATGFSLNQSRDGYRFIVEMADRRVEGSGSTEASAVTDALEKLAGQSRR
jgi:hypothetical protein